MAVALATEQDAWAFLDYLLKLPPEQGVDFREIDIGTWAKITVDIGETQIESSMTAPWMEAFVNVQRNVYRLAAFAKYGTADTKKLSQLDLEEFEIPVIITGGSSHYLAPLKETLEKVARQLVAKMSGQDIAKVLIAAALIGGTVYGISNYLEQQKQIRIAEVQSEEKKAFFDAMKFTTEQQHASFQKLVDTLNQSEIGKRVIAATENVNEGMLKAAAKTDAAVVQGVVITAGDAQELRSSTRQRATLKIVTQELRVTDINTGDDLITSVEFTDPETNDQIRASFQDALLVEGSSDHIYAALKDRGTVWVEMQIREVRGEIRSVEIRKATREPPAEARAAAN